MNTRLQIKWLLPVLLLMILVGGGACSDDEETIPEEYGYKVIELNMEDHRFEDLLTINIINDAHCYSNHIFDIFKKNDSVFISYYGVLLYPTRLPEDFSILSDGIVFTGAVKRKPNGVDFHPLILDGFKFMLNTVDLHAN